MPKDRDLLSLFESRLHSQPDMPLYSFLDRDGAVSQSLTVSALFVQARDLAEVLQAYGLKHQPVVLLYPHGSEFIVAFFAALLAGAYPVPVARPRGRDWRVLMGIIRASRAGALLTLSATARHLPAELTVGDPLQIVHTDNVHTRRTDRMARWQRPAPESQDLAFIQYTSGSTSAPKGVEITHAAILHNCELIAQAFACSGADIGVSWLPFHHDMGLIGHVITPLYCGIHNYFLAPSGFAAKPVRWLQAISRYQGTISGAPDFAYEHCHSRVIEEELEALDLRSWRLAYCGAQRVSADTLRKFSARFERRGFTEQAWHPCYGLAEATLYVCSRQGLHTNRQQGRLRHTEREDVSIGQLNGRVDIRIVDTEAGREVAEGEAGEILVRSAALGNGYHRDAVSTAATFDVGRTGFLRTGDLGYVHEGNLYFTGRCKTLIKRRGRSFHAEDIEAEVEALLCDKGVERSAAFELNPDAADSLVILLEADGSIDPRLIELSIPDLQSRLCQSPGILATDIVVAPRHSLPLTSSGKLQRMRCRERYLAGDYLNRADKECEHAEKC
ncbi:MAG: fatty acyl-AMP ligase [Gammaproteobacteria bacterium]|nr:fatty acyl-AMP ligase [Gammaproteobacteria bacterium]